MVDAVLTGAGWALFSMTALGIAYASATAIALRMFLAGARSVVTGRNEAVTLLKPLCGAEPRLEENLRTFLEQDHGGPVQVLYGYAMTDDAAGTVVSSLKTAFPATDHEAVVSARRHGPNAKVSNLVNLDAEAKHPVVVLSDSDMSVGRDYLRQVLGALDGEGVGVVSLLYRGRGDAGFWSRLSAAGISYQFLPNAIFAVWSTLATPCMGSTIAIRRDVLDRIGGLASFSAHLADDHAIGEAVRRAGLKVVVPPHVITHACGERSFLQVWRHEVRWGATVRGVVPLRYLGSVITYPFPLAVLGTLVTQQYALGGVLAATALLLRTAHVTTVDRRTGGRTAPLWMLPIRDVLSFAVFFASLFARRVDWRGSRHRIQPRGQLAPDQEYPA